MPYMSQPLPISAALSQTTLPLSASSINLLSTIHIHHTFEVALLPEVFFHQIHPGLPPFSLLGHSSVIPR